MAEPTAQETADPTAAPFASSAGSSSPGAGEGEAPAERTRPLADPEKPDKGGFYWGTGRRKTAVARVRLRPVSEAGSAKFTVNGKAIDDFFSEPQDRASCLAPLKATSMEGKVEVHAKLHGGGTTGQGDSVLLGVARALKGYDPTLEDILRDEGHLTRDPREVERKKYGQLGARRKFQFSKR